MVNLKLTGSPERHCRLHSTTLTLAPLNKVHPAAFPVSVTQERRTVMLQLRLIGISLSHFSNHTWHVPVRWEALSWWDEEAPGRQRAAQTLYLLPARRPRRKRATEKLLQEVSCVCVWGNSLGFGLAVFHVKSCLICYATRGMWECPILTFQSKTPIVED